MNQYPKWLYHRTKGAKLLHNEEEEKALGRGWKDTPAEFEKKDALEADETEPVNQAERAEIVEGTPDLLAEGNELNGENGQ